MRVIDETGKQFGLINIFEAIDLAKSKGLDLIQVTDKVVPPVCRIGDYGKYLYSLQKKERKIKAGTKESKLKEIQIGFNISSHDIEVKAKQAEKFLKEGHKIKLSMVLRGREKAMGEFAKNKVQFFAKTLEGLTPTKTERELKREPRGFTIIISKR